MDILGPSPREADRAFVAAEAPPDVAAKAPRGGIPLVIKLPPMPNPVSDPNPPNPVKKLAGLNTGALGSSSTTVFDGDGDDACNVFGWWLC